MTTAIIDQPGAPGSLTRQHFTDLVLSLGLVDLTDRERAFLAWLAEWDQPTVETAAGLFAKLTRTAATR